MPKKKVVVNVEETVEEVEETVEEVVEEPKAKKTKVVLTAKFKAVDEDGDKVKLSIEGEGNNVVEALANMDFPKGINVPVELTVAKDGRTFMVRLAQHKVRAILENKDTYEFERVFRGV